MHTLLKMKIAQMSLEVWRNGSSNVKLAGPVAIAKLAERGVDLGDVLREDSFRGTCMRFSLVVQSRIVQEHL